MYTNTMPARRGGKNSLQEEQATACEDEKTNLDRDAVLRKMYQWLGNRNFKKS
jgi:hypothetical protein